MPLSATGYRPRDAEHAVLYRVIAKHLDAFLETAWRHADGASLPGFVEQEFRDILTCGVLAHGFARLRYTDCALEQLVPFSCKGRRFCPSCGGRRMTECAARLVDEVLPRVPVRQWVLSLPYRLRYLPGVGSRVGARGTRRGRARASQLPASPRAPIRHSQRALGMRDRHPAVWRRIEFEHPFPYAPPTDDEVGVVLARIALGPRAGARVWRVGDDPDAPWVRSTAPRHAHLAGFDLHANVAVPASDRARLEQLCRYLLRPAVAQDRLRLLDDGRIVLTLKTAWADGTRALVFEPLELLEKLAALTPRPRINLMLYHGLLAPHAGWRARVVAYGEPPIETPAGPSASANGTDGSSAAPRSRHWAWADLMRRAFEIDVLACPRCGGRLRLIATIDDPDAIRAVLAASPVSRELADRAPPFAPPLDTSHGASMKRLAVSSPRGVLLVGCVLRPCRVP